MTSPPTSNVFVRGYGTCSLARETDFARENALAFVATRNVNKQTPSCFLILPSISGSVNAMYTWTRVHEIWVMLSDRFRRSVGY